MRELGLIILGMYVVLTLVMNQKNNSYYGKNHLQFKYN